MKKIFVSIIVCLMVTVPFQSVSGEKTSLSTNSFGMTIEHSRNDPVIDLINQVNESIAYTYLEQLVSFGPRPTGLQNCKDAAVYVHDEFEKLGLFTYIDQWRFPFYKSQNVIATLNGTDPTSDAVVLLCAHIDTTYDSPGANDDGAGVATLLTIANICSKYTFNHTIRFVVTSGEEIGLYGSHDFARKQYMQNENIVAVLNVDTIGNTTVKGGKVVYLLKPDRSDWISTLIEEIAQLYYEYINLTAVSIANRNNDHRSFLNYGYDSVQFVQLARGNYPLHTPEDTIERVNFTYVVKVIKLVLAAAITLAERPIDLQVRIVTPREGYLYLFDRPVFQQPKITLGGSGARGMTFILGRTTARINITTDEEIGSVAYCINGLSSFPGFIQEGPYEWVIKISAKSFPSIGKYTFGVYVSTISGKTAYDEMDFFILTLY
jgi:hypothetical protein